MKKILGVALILALTFGTVAFAFESDDFSDKSIMLRGGEHGGGGGGHGGGNGGGSGGGGGNGGGHDGGHGGNHNDNSPRDGSGPRRDGTGNNPLHPNNPNKK